MLRCIAREGWVEEHRIVTQQIAELFLHLVDHLDVLLDLWTVLVLHLIENRVHNRGDRVIRLLEQPQHQLPVRLHVLSLVLRKVGHVRGERRIAQLGQQRRPHCQGILQLVKVDLFHEGAFVWKVWSKDKDEKLKPKSFLKVLKENSKN